MSRTHILPAGRYFIGDPCYCFNDVQWDNYIEVMNPDSVFNFSDRKCFVANTLYGDGSYPDQENFYYYVDAGLIGATPIDIITTSQDSLVSLGRFIDFPEDFEVSFFEDGSINIGHISIQTDDEEIEEDNYDENDDLEDIDDEY